MKVFCGNCGKKFLVKWLYKKKGNDTFPNENAFCPKCGGYEIYRDTKMGADESIENAIEYENILADYIEVE